MSSRHFLAVALLVVLAGCSNKTTAPSSSALGIEADSKDLPGVPPIEHANLPRIKVPTDGDWTESQKVGSYSLAPEAIHDLELVEGRTVTFTWAARPRDRYSALAGHSTRRTSPTRARATARTIWATGVSSRLRRRRPPLARSRRGRSTGST
jgi:hypothetical protein